MLTELRIDNFTIISSLHLNFEEGLTSFTGETGAGKSIIIDALTLVLGGKTDASVVRSGQDLCEIVARFKISPQHQGELWLKEQGLRPDSHELTFHRIITREGRSKSYINGLLFPPKKIKALAACFIDIHGQNQSQALISHHRHREDLDQFAHHPEQLQDVLQAYHDIQAAQLELKKLKQEQETLKYPAQLDELINELETLNYQDGELEQIHLEHQNLHHAVDYLNLIEAIQKELEDPTGLSIGKNLNKVAQLFNKLPQSAPVIHNAQILLQNILIQYDELQSELNLFTHQIKVNPLRLAQLEKRLSQVHALARKHQIDSRNLNSYLNQLIGLRTQAAHNQEKQASAAAKQEQAIAAYRIAAENLRKSREAHAPILAAKLTESIRQLGMPGAQIEIELTPIDTLQAHGMDKIEYKIATNPGSKSDTLSKIASGGELSRLSLAIEVITAKKQSKTCLIFDEVDVGIGGATAALVGKALRLLGTHVQVFCITHQAQVACFAHHHFLVKKTSQNLETFCQVIALHGQERIHEIARMSGGIKLSEEGFEHAAALLNESQAVAEELIL